MQIIKKFIRKIIFFCNEVSVRYRCKKLHITYVENCYVGKRVRTLGNKPTVILNQGSRICDDCVLWGEGIIEIGKDSSVGEYGWIHSMAGHNVTIGNNVNIAAFSFIINCDHGTKLGIVMMNQKLVGGDILIGNDVWIGANVTILKDTVISDGTIIGASSVVKGHYNDKNSIICGPKAKVIKYRE